MAAHNEFEWFRGEDVLITFTHTAGVDITGFVLSFHLKTSLGNPNTLVTIPATITNGSAPSGGVYTVAVPAATNTTTLAAGRYVHSVARTDSGSAAIFSEGGVLVKPSAQLA